MADTLASAEAIRSLAKDYVTALKDPSRPYRGWCVNLTEYLSAVSAASAADRASPEFQKKLWDEEIIASTGQGHVPVDAALSDPGFREWLAERSLQPLPADDAQVLEHLRGLYDELQERLARFTSKTPRLKIFRVLASFYPRHFTTIADIGRLATLHRKMLNGRKADEIERHRNVLRRLDEVLGPAPQELSGWVERMTLPWFLLDMGSKEQEGPTPPSQLSPLPAARRRRGMTATKGNYNWILRVLDFVGDGVTRDDLFAFIKQENPALKDASIAVNVNIMRSELGVLDRDGDLFVPSEVGRRLVETGDPSTLAPWLLTRILGVDHVIADLRDEGGLPHRKLIERLQSVNPGWTTGFAPQAVLAWLRALGVTETTSDGRIQLTARGKLWAGMIHWKPESLDASEGEEDTDPAETDNPPPPEETSVELPPFKNILERLPSDLRFAKDQVAALHAGLWSHPRRHFAILTGLSGSGKTSLARAYARALISLTSGPEEVSRRLLTIPVAPGWTDPSALLGYLNPMRPGEYVTTPFLRLLISCAAHPSKVYVAVLDEMNLSHPEQYLAPLLSGMEVADEALVFHGEEGELDGVPGRLDRYPANLVLIGTVNMDETTHGLSDKVLDRAITIEFWDIDLAHYPRWGSRGLAAPVEERVREVLGDLLRVLSPVRLHFGWRVVDDVLDFMKRTGDDAALEADLALDWIIYSKIVPKLRGYDSKKFREALEACRQELSRHGLKRSAAKVADLCSDLEATGSARFWR
jgi:5-methylcytosine-specific restriction enzyme B